MKRLIKKKLLVTVASIGLLLSSFYLIFGVFQGDPFYPLYLTNCAGCHGRDFEGTNLGQSLLSTPNIGGNQVSELIYSITTGAPDRGMPAFDSILSPEQIRSVAILVAERQQQIRFIEFNMEGNHDLRQARQSNTELSIETFFTGLSDKPYSIAVLPNDQILVTEKSGSLISIAKSGSCLLYTSPSPRDRSLSRMPSSA